MRKVKFAILIVLVLCLVTALFVACDQTDNKSSGTPPTIPTEQGPGISADGYETLSAGEAWDTFVDAARAANADTGHYVWNDSIVRLGYTKDKNGSYYAVRTWADINFDNDADSSMLLELWRADAAGELTEVLLGLYYYESTLVFDCTGLNEGATVVKTDNINLTSVEATLRELFGGNSLATFILDHLFKLSIDPVGEIGGLIPALFGDSRLTTAADGTQRLEIPVPLTGILSGALSGLLTPGAIIPTEIYDLVKDVLGIDLGLGEALEDLSVYLVADLDAGDAQGVRKLTGFDIAIGLDFNTTDTSYDENYGMNEEFGIDISIGASPINNTSLVRSDVKGYLTAPKAEEGEPESEGGRGLDLDALGDFSPLTIDLTLSIGLDIAENVFTPKQLLGVFGVVAESLFESDDPNNTMDPATKELLLSLLEKELKVSDIERTLKLRIAGEIDMFDNDGTNLLVELTGEDPDDEVRARIAYVGRDKALYVDFSGIIGTGKFVVNNLDLNNLLSGLIDQLVGLVNGALEDAGLLPGEVDKAITAANELISGGKAVIAEGKLAAVEGAELAAEESAVIDAINKYIADNKITVTDGALEKVVAEEVDKEAAEEVQNMLASGEILKHVGANAQTGKPITDVFDLVTRILDGIDIETGSSVLDIRSIRIALTQEVMDYIFGLVDLGGISVPIDQDGVSLTITNNGFMTDKDIVIDVGLADPEVEGLGELAGAQVGINVQFGSTKDGFDEVIDSVSNDKNSFIPIASFDSIYSDGVFDIDTDAILQQILAGIKTAGVGLQANITIDALEGGFADIMYESGNDFAVTVLAAFEEAFGVDATLTLKAQIVDMEALLAFIDTVPGDNDPPGAAADIGLLIGALNIYLELATDQSATAPLRIWLNREQGSGEHEGEMRSVLYITTTEELLGGLSLKFDITDFIASGASGAGGAEAISADGEGNTDGSGETGGTEAGPSEGSNILTTLMPVIMQLLDIAEVEVGNLYIDAALSGGLIAVLLNAAGVNGLEITATDGSELGADLGLSIELGNGLTLAGEDGLSIGLDLGLGNNFDLGLTLGGINAAINQEDYIPAIPDDVEFVDFLAEPYAYLSLELGIGGNINPTNIELGDGLGSIQFPDGLDIDLVLALEAKLDLRTLLGIEIPDNDYDKTELALEIRNGDEVLLAAYYEPARDEETQEYVGVLYVDAGTLLGARISAQIDLMGLLSDMLGGGEGASAVSAAENNEEETCDEHLDRNKDYVCDRCGAKIECTGHTDVKGGGENGDEPDKKCDNCGTALDYSIGLFGFLMNITSGGFVVSVAQGLTAVINDLLGVHFGEIDAVLELDWSHIISTESGYKILDAQLGLGDIGTAEVSVSSLNIALGGAALEKEIVAITPTDYNSIGRIELTYGTDGAINGIDTTLLMLNSVYAELSGSIDLSVDPKHDDDMTIGEWIAPFISGLEGVTEEMTSMIRRLVLAFSIDRSVSTHIEFVVRALLRGLQSGDIGAILGQSDIALEIMADGRELLMVYIIANEETGRSDLYISSDAEGIIGGNIMIPNVSLESLFAPDEHEHKDEGAVGKDGNVIQGSAPDGKCDICGEPMEQSKQAAALTAADEDHEHKDEGAVGEDGTVIQGSEPDGKCDICGAVMEKDISTIFTAILGVINRIYMNDEQLEVGLGANFLRTLLGVAFGVDVAPESFVQLNPDNSFLSLYYGKNDSGRREIGLDLSVGVDPFTAKIGLGGIEVGVNDETKSVKPAGFDQTEWVNILDINNPDNVLSLNATVGLEIELGSTEDLKNGELPIGDILSAVGTDLALALGVKIEDSLKLGVNISVAGNIYFADAEKTEIAVVISDRFDADRTILGLYLRGDDLYVDMGIISDHNFKFEGVGIIEKLLAEVNGRLSVQTLDGGSTGEAVAASETVASSEDEALELLDILLSAGEGHIALGVTEQVLVALIAAAAEKPEITEIFEGLNLGAEAVVDINFAEPSINVAVDTNYASLRLAIEDIMISTNADTDLTGVIDGIAADDAYQNYAESSIARFALDLTVSYSADATYQLVADPESYSDDERYSRVDRDGVVSYVPDPDGDYVRRPISFSDIIGALTDTITGALTAPGEDGSAPMVDQETMTNIVGPLLAALGIDLYINDPIGDSLAVSITGLLDLEALGLSGMLGSLDFSLFTELGKPENEALKNEFILKVLSALQVGIEIDFNPGAEGADIGIYLVNGDIYINLEGIGGPRISADLFNILKQLGVEMFASYGENNAAGGEAVTAAAGSDGGEADLGTIESVLNALVAAIVFRSGSADPESAIENILEGGIALDVLLPTNLIGNVVSLITKGEPQRFDDLMLAEDSKIGLSVNGGGLTLGVEAHSDTGFTLKVSAAAGLEIDIASDVKSLLTSNQRATYTDVTELVLTIASLFDDDETNDGEFGSERIKVSFAGKATFDSAGESSYDLGSLLGQYLEDLVLELNTEEAFSDGIGFRLTAAFDLSKIGIAALTAGTDEETGEAAPDWGMFLETTDLDSLEVALEVMEMDTEGNFTGKVLAGIYIYDGNLYLDGTDIFEVVENYSYVPNFLDFVVQAIQIGSESGKSLDDPAAAAMTAAEGSASTVRDAILQLVYSDTAIQIVITKSIISALLMVLLPDDMAMIGGLTDIFDAFEVSVGAEIGKYEYLPFDEAFYVYTDGQYVRYTGDYKEGLYVSDGKGGYVLANDAYIYRLFEEEAFMKNADGKGTYVKLADEDTFLLRSAQTFYDSNYNIALGGTEGQLYVFIDGAYEELTMNDDGNTVTTYDRLYGYERIGNAELSNLVGGTPSEPLYRVYAPYTNIDEFYLELGVNVGALSLGLALGGINLEFGNSDPVVPSYILEGKTKSPAPYDSQGNAYTLEDGVYTKVDQPVTGEEYYYDLPLLPFYDSVITIGMSVEIELAITEGKIDIGTIMSGILGNVEGLEINIPNTNKGYSSAHLRLDVALVLDMQDLPASELEIELYNLSSETGAEVRWLAAYYMDGTIYLDLSFFGLPKVAAPMTEISDWIEGQIAELLNTSIYDDVEVGSVGASEAITADESVSNGATPADALTTEERVAALLISERRLAISVGNALMRYLLDNITLNGDALSMLIYDDLKGSAEVVIDISDGAEIAVEAQLRLDGDRYIRLPGAATEQDGVTYIFLPEGTEADSAHPEGKFIRTEEGDYREAGDSDIAEGIYTLYDRYEVTGADKYYVYTENVNGDYVFDDAKDCYVSYSASEHEGEDRYARTEKDIPANLPTYEFRKAVDANPNDYDTVLDLYVGINDLDMYFTEEREFTLTPEDLEEYGQFNNLESVSLSETISLGLLFDAIGDEIDLSALLEYLFPDSNYDFEAIVDVVGGSEDVEQMIRNLDITVAVELKLGAFINYLRSLAAQYELSYETTVEVEKEDANGVVSAVEETVRVAIGELPEQLDIITFIKLIMSLLGAQEDAQGNLIYDDPANAVDDLFGIEDILNFVNASVTISTSASSVTGNGEEVTPAHTMLGVYYSLGPDEGTEVTDTNEDKYEGENRFSHYYASPLGSYKWNGEGYVVAEEGYTGMRYVYDPSFLYPDANGDHVRELAGLYVDLSYLGQPGVFINITELFEMLEDMMPVSGEEDGGSRTEAITAEEPVDEGGSAFTGFPLDLGELFSTDIVLSDSLPLLSNTIAGYVTAFVVGARITSSYIMVLLQNDAINNVLSLLIGSDDLTFEGVGQEQSSLTINVDVNNYLYATLSEATTEQIEFADTRFVITEDKGGMYYITSDGYYALRDEMTAAEEASYSRKYWNITPIDDLYLHVGDEHVLISDATNADWLRAERYDASTAGKNKALAGTYRYYIPDGDDYSELGTTYNDKDVFVVYADTARKPLIEAEIHLWGHALTLGINLPETAAAEFGYEEMIGGGDYTRTPMVTYTPDTVIDGNAQVGADGGIVADADKGSKADYLYYRGNYYPVAEDSVYTFNGEDYVPLGTGYVEASAAQIAAGKGLFVEEDNYVLATEDDIGASTTLYEKYEYRLATDEEREAGGELYIKNADGTYGPYAPQEGVEAPAELYVKETGYKVVEGETVPGDEYYVIDGVKYVAASTEQIAAGEGLFVKTASWDEFKQDPANGSYYLYIEVKGENFRQYVRITPVDLYDGVVYNYIYSFAGEGKGDYDRVSGGSLVSVPQFRVFFDNVVENYVRDDTTEYWFNEFGEKVAVTEEAPDEGVTTYTEDDMHFVYVDGKFVSVADHVANGGSLEGLKVYESKHIAYGDTGELYYLSLSIRGELSLAQPEGAEGDSSSPLSEVLGAVVGDLGALFTTQKGYKAVLPFEISAVIKLAYADPEDSGSLYIAGIELAIDIWRTEMVLGADDGDAWTEGELTHIIGIYYMSDVWDIDDFDRTNDKIDGAMLYVDLSWLFGADAKFKVDISDYPLEDLIWDNLGTFGSLLGTDAASSEGEALTAADVAVSVSDPEKGGVLLNVFPRSIVLQASAALLKLIIGLVAPDMSAQLEEMLPNLSIKAAINAAPYDITVGATLYDEDGGTALLDLGLTLNLFNMTEPSKGLQLGFGSLESYERLSAKQLAEKSSDYIYAAGITYDEDGNSVGSYEYVKDANDRVNYHGDLYVLMPAGYAQLTTEAQVGWAFPEEGDAVKVYTYNSSSKSFVQLSGATPDAVKALFAEGKRVYVLWSELSDDQKASAADAGLSAATEAGYVADKNGDYKYVPVFGEYQTLLALDLKTILADLKNIDVLNKVLLPGLASAGIESIELGGTLELGMTFNDALNWTRQMTKLLDVSGAGETFEMLLTSLAMDSSEFVSAIGLNVDLSLRVLTANLIEALPGLIPADEKEELDIGALLAALLPGAEIYIEIAVSGNFYGEALNDAEPMQIWVQVGEDGFIDITAYAPAIGEILGTGDDGTGDNAYGDLLKDGLKVDGEKLGLSVDTLVGLVAGGGQGGSEAVTAADEGGLQIGSGDANIGIIPENIWGILDLLVGQVLFANNTISVGITENLLAGLIEALVPEFEGSEYLPTFTVTSDGTSTSGININVGGGSPSVNVHLGIKGGYAESVSADELTALIEELGSDAVYGVDAAEFVAALTKDEDDNIPLTGKQGTDEFGLAIYTSSAEAWLGDRYKYENGGFVQVDDPYAGAFTPDENGIYGKITSDMLPEGKKLQSYQGTAEGTYVEYGEGTYMLISRIEELMRSDAFGEAYVDYVYQGDKFSFDEDAVTGHYMRLGDVSIDLTLGGLRLGLNTPSIVEENEPVSTAVDITEAEVRLGLSLDVGFEGKTGADLNLGSLVDMILGLVTLEGISIDSTNLAVNVTGDFGHRDGAYFGVRLDGYVKLGALGLFGDADVSEGDALQVRLEIVRYNYKDGEPSGEDIILGVYFADDTIYADLSGVLGEGVKGKITSVGLLEILQGAIAGGSEDGDPAQQTLTADSEASTIQDTVAMTPHSGAFLGAMINPGYFSLRLTLAAVEAILHKLGADNPDNESLSALMDIELPSLGDIVLEANGIRKEGEPMFSLNAQVSDRFSASLDVMDFKLGTKPIYNGDPYADDAAWATLYDVKSGALGDFTLSASAKMNITMTSEGLVSPDENDPDTWGGADNFEDAKARYDSSLAGWVIGLVTDKLGATSVFVTPYDKDNEAEYNAYGGPIYELGADDSYKLLGKVDKDGNGYHAVKEDGTYESGVTAWTEGKEYYRTTIVEATFAASNVNLQIGLDADINLGAILSYGIAGILFSDLRVTVGLGSPFDSTILKLYYLGSSRLSEAATNNIYTLQGSVKDGKIGAFSDAIYIDATGLGLGKIKFQGIAGLLGANIGDMYDDATALSAAEGEDTAGTDTETKDVVSGDLALNINVSENFIGISVPPSTVSFVLGILQGSMDFALPEVQTLALEMMFGSDGLDTLTLRSTLDPAGTGAVIELSDFNIALTNSLDVGSLAAEVSTSYGGLTYSKSAGVMTDLLQVRRRHDSGRGVARGHEPQCVHKCR